MDLIEKRKAKYTTEYYHKLKKKLNVFWRDVPFTCHNCGTEFHVERVKPQTLPVNCTDECRMDAFDESIGEITSTRILELDWNKVRRLIEAKKNRPPNSRDHGDCSGNPT